MNRKIICVIGLLFCILLNTLTAFAQTRGAGNVKVKNNKGKTVEIKLYDASYALVIGNGKYTNGWDTLPGVASDVKAVTDVLTDQGFNVETAENLSSREFTNRIQQFIDDYGYQPNNRLLIYYAGHGHTLKSTGDGRDLGYVVPVDAPDPKKDEIGFKRKAIPMDDILNFAKKIQSKHALFLFDSCFSGRLVTRNTIAVPPIIQESVAYPVRQFITAGAANQSVPDESIFRRSFVRALEGEADRNADGYITGTELAEYLKEKVTNYSNRQQTPQYGKINDIELDRGDFVFRVKDNSKTIQNTNIISKTKPLNKVPEEIKVANSASNNSATWFKIKPIALKLLEYDIVNKFSQEELAIVELNGKYGFIDRTGKLVTPIEYDNVGGFSEGMAQVIKKVEGRYSNSTFDKIGYIDKTGQLAIPLKYERSSPFSEGLAGVSDNEYGNIGFIDKTGREIIPQDKYYFYNSFSDGLAMVGVGTQGSPFSSKKGFIDKTGREVITRQYWEAGSFSEGLAPVMVGDYGSGKFGFIDKQNRMVIPPKYNNAYSFSEGFAAVQIGPYEGGKRGFIDKTGREVISIKYDFVEAFFKGFSKVTLNGKYGFIDKTGREIVPIKYDRAYYLDKGLFLVVIDNKYGFVDITGKEIIPIKYENNWCNAFLNQGFFGLVLNGKKGFVDLYGNEYFDF